MNLMRTVKNTVKVVTNTGKLLVAYYKGYVKYPYKIAVPSAVFGEANKTDILNNIKETLNKIDGVIDNSIDTLCEVIDIFKNQDKNLSSLAPCPINEKYYVCLQNTNNCLSKDICLTMEEHSVSRPTIGTTNFAEFEAE